MTRKAGSIVIDLLRERIRLGRYFGRWGPGDRLPSVRELAELEAVDRKTAAAAYRCLESEGVVRVEPRSGVYLNGEPGADGADPLQRLHRQWLENALASASELGLDPDTLRRMFLGVARVTEQRIPMVDEDLPHARLLARELSARTGREFVPIQPARLMSEGSALREAPFLVATPGGCEALEALHDRMPAVRLGLDPHLFEAVCVAAKEGDVLVVVGSRVLEDELRRAVERGLIHGRHRVVALHPSSREDIESMGAISAVTLIWPGAPDWVDDVVGKEARRLPMLVSRSTLREIRCQVARAAMEPINTSTASSRPPLPASSTRPPGRTATATR